ncbi:protein TolQ [Thermodesulfovibrio sp.]|jgi:biopolymer transport protein TolQ|uniref:protein TolQ n=1 Tax=Thermodesulfovibrio TaxID=28261 RepID=UPI00261FEDD1|nr:protein TolQ [Thermodesulfovibrio sp.]
MELTVIDLIKQTGIVAKIVLLILLFFSIFSWAIIFYKLKVFKKMRIENTKFFEAFLKTNSAKELFSDAKRYELSPIASLYRNVFVDVYGKTNSNVEALVKRLSSEEANRVESYLGFLATTGSTTPFIGLFGTVWGIMDAFRSIGVKGTASIATVAPGIAEALIATAAGLFAAIPAVIFYNYFTSQANKLINEVNDFSETLIKYQWQD